MGIDESTSSCVAKRLGYTDSRALKFTGRQANNAHTHPLSSLFILFCFAIYWLGKSPLVHRADPKPSVNTHPLPDCYSCNTMFGSLRSLALLRETPPSFNLFSAKVPKWANFPVQPSHWLFCPWACIVVAMQTSTVCAAAASCLGVAFSVSLRRAAKLLASRLQLVKAFAAAPMAMTQVWLPMTPTHLAESARPVHEKTKNPSQ